MASARDLVVGSGITLEENTGDVKATGFEVPTKWSADANGDTDQVGGVTATDITVPGVPHWKKFTVNYSDFVGSGSTEQITLGTLGNASYDSLVMKAFGRVEIAFAGPTLSTAVAEVGEASTPDTDGYVLSTGFDLMSTGYAQMSAADKGVHLDVAEDDGFVLPGGTNVTMDFTLSGETVDDLTAGKVEVHMLFVDIPT